MKIKTIAMYLPQFHQIPENDEWWGKGYTEWTAVKAAKPLFEEHKQPKKPWKENYYDLLQKSTMQCQSRLMKQYGIDGLCFYHYYFKDGQRVLERPSENLLTWKDLDIPFCFCWDNTSWARTWSNIGNKNSWSDKFEKRNGNQEKDILLEQKYGREFEWKKHFEYLLPFFKDERYIKKDGTPIFLIYKPEEMGCLYRMLQYWKKIAKSYAIQDIYFIGVNTLQNRKGLDAILLNAPVAYFNPLLRGRNLMPDWIEGVKTFEYEKVWNNILSAQPITGCKTYFGGFVNYDDTPRRNKNGTVMKGFSIEKFRNNLCNLYKKNLILGNEFQFLNAWNEWGEGMYLEADEEYGFQYLEAVRDAREIAMNGELNSVSIFMQNEEKYYEEDEKLQRDLNKHRLIANCLDRWMTLKEKGINLSEYLKHCGFRRVAVYGMGILGKHLLFDLEQAEFEVAYIIDRCVDLHYPKVEIRNLDDTLDTVDVIVVTAVAEFDEISEVLRGKVNSPILSIMELINEV